MSETGSNLDCCSYKFKTKKMLTDKPQIFMLGFNYLWRNDLDNYARISGYVYQLGKKILKPGLEALFIDHNTKKTNKKINADD